jgi:hypothetical protein
MSPKMPANVFLRFEIPVSSSESFVISLAFVEFCLENSLLLTLAAAAEAEEVKDWAGVVPSES